MNFVRFIHLNNMPNVDIEDVEYEDITDEINNKKETTEIENNNENNNENNLNDGTE